MKFWVYDKLYLFYTPINKICFRLNGISYGKGLRVYGRVFVKNLRGRGIIGDNVTINSAGWANPIGCGSRTYFQIINGGVLKIGSNVGLSNTAITCARSIEIGDNVLVGAGSCIFDTDFHSQNEASRIEWRVNGQKEVKTDSITIGNDVFIGANCMILKGTIIEDGSIIGAGAVVAGKKLKKAFWCGNPIKRIEKNESIMDNKYTS